MAFLVLVMSLRAHESQILTYFFNIHLSKKCRKGRNRTYLLPQLWSSNIDYAIFSQNAVLG